MASIKGAKRRKPVISSDSEGEIDANTGENIMEVDVTKNDKIERQKLYEKTMLTRYKTDLHMSSLRETIESLKDFARATSNLHREVKEKISIALDQYTEIEQSLTEEREASRNYTEVLEDRIEGDEEAEKMRQKEMINKEAQCCILPSVEHKYVQTKESNNETHKTRPIERNVQRSEQTTIVNRINNEEQTWANVVGRRQRKEISESQITKQVAEVKKSKKPQTNAIEIKVNKEEDYIQTLKKVKADTRMAENGEDITRVRKTRSGNMLIEIKSDSTKTDVIKDVVKSALGENASVKTLTPTVKLEIRDIDGAADMQEVQEAIIKNLKTTREEIATKVVAMYPIYGGMQRAIVIATNNDAKKLLKEGKVIIGWLSCKIKEKTEVITCYRCQQTGHMAADCKGIDRSKNCRRCGEEGHGSKECQRELCCMICKEKGYERIKHWIGSRTCEINKNSNK